MSFMTEEEAKTKWCPFTRVRADNSASYNRCIDAEDEDGNEVEVYDLEGAMCIGTACMVWLKSWEYSEKLVGSRPEGSGWEKHGGPYGDAVDNRQQWCRPIGRCGLTQRS
jgi:hypothetical protein